MTHLPSRKTAVCSALLAGTLLVLALPAMAQTGQPKKKQPVSVERTFAAPAGTLLRLDAAVPVRLRLTAATKQEAVLSVRGEDIIVTAEEKDMPSQDADGPAPSGTRAKALLVRIEAQDLASGRGLTAVVELRLPEGLKSRFTLAEGQVQFSRTKGEVVLDLGQGDVQVDDAEGRLTASVGQGSLTCRRGSLEGRLSVQSGLLAVSGTQGRLSLSGPCGNVEAGLPGIPTDAELRRDSVTLTVRDGDVQAGIRNGRLVFGWAGGDKADGRRLNFTAENAEVVLRLPEGYPMELMHDHAGTEAGAPGGAQPGKVRKIKRGLSNAFTAEVPAEKEMERSGRKMKVAQGRQVLNGGGNRVSVHSTDSAVSIEKIKKAK